MSSHSNPQWGRNAQVQTSEKIQSIFILLMTPSLTWFLVNACTHHQCSSWDLVQEIAQATRDGGLKGFAEFIYNGIPAFDWTAFYVYTIWYVGLLVLTILLPGTYGTGNPTPAGHILKYKLNGFQCWFVSHLLCFICIQLKLFPGSIWADNWASLWTIGNIYGYALSLFCYIKGYLFPSHPDDRKFSGFAPYDFLMGIELNPRVGEIDLKLFHIGRFSMISWSMINLSHGYKQYIEYGYVTNSMLIMIFLESVYIVDFFWKEDWYLRTIDIQHDHFGYYLAWGEMVWLLYLYTLQGVFLVRNPVELETWECIGILTLGGVGYVMFRLVNNQKDYFRETKGKCLIWGKPAEYIGF